MHLTQTWSRALRTRELWLKLVAALLPAVIFSVSVMRKGIPSLRHDWLWIGDRGDFLNNAADAFSGWNSVSIGEPQLHATTQLQVAVTWILVALTGSQAALAIEVFFIGAACAYAGWRLAVTYKNDAVVGLGSALLAVLNPWTYTQTVAGHISMIAAYAGLLLLTCELVRPRADRYIVAVAIMLSSLQIQFFLIVLAVAAIWSVARREPRLGLVTALVLMLPAIAGLVGDRAAFVDVPRNLFWLQTQSLGAHDALTLRGYFAHYTATLSQPTIAALWVVAAIAGIGGLLSLRRKWLALLPLLMIVVLLFVMGLKGPLRGLFEFGIDRLPVVSVYRELYDLVAVFVVGYIALGTLACARVVPLRWVWSIAALLIAVPWFLTPPSRFWVGIDAVPQTTVHAPPSTRFALLPAFQPLSFRSEGSGLDPAAYIHAGNVVPLNAESPSYPADVALAVYEQKGDDGELAALSVSTVVAQPWMHSLTADIDRQRAAQMPPVRREPGSRIITDYLPEVTLSALPRISLFGNNIGYGEVLFSDVAGLVGAGVPAAWSALPEAQPIAPSHDRLGESQGWVDVRLAFPSQPELGQGLGGALTTSRTALLPIAGGSNAMVFVRGTLRTSDGRRLTSSTKGYAWIPIPARTQAVRCTGECVVAAEGGVPSGLHAGSAEPLPWKSAAATTIEPWLVSVIVPAAAKAQMLRYNVRFDSDWVALDGPAPLPHFRVDTSVNGWVVPSRTLARRIVLLETTAMIQTLLAFVGVAWCFAVIAFFCRSRYARNARDADDAFTPIEF